MNKKFGLFFLIPFLGLMASCNRGKIESDMIEEPLQSIPWWESVDPVIIEGDDFYGRQCSITKVSRDAGVMSESVIFTVPSRIMTYCKKQEGNKNDLEHNGDYVILTAYRQTIGAGSWVKERYRSQDLETWEEYIGPTWKNGEEYEAWRAIGSSSSKADSLKKIDPESP